MSGQTYVLFHVEQPLTRKTYTTKQRRSPKQIDYQSDPLFTKLSFSTAQPIAKFKGGKITYRRSVQVDGLFHGEMVHELIEEMVFKIFYKHQKKIMVAAAQSSVAIAAMNSLARDFRDEIALAPFEIDFDRLVDAAADIQAVWFRRVHHDERIHREAVFGDHIDGSAEYDRMKQDGEITSITASVEFREEPLKIRFSRYGFVSFLDTRPVSTCLELIETIIAGGIAVPVETERPAKERSHHAEKKTA